MGVLTRKRLTTAGAIAALVAISLGITSAFGGGGFLTKKKANKRFATKAQVAKLATKAEVANLATRAEVASLATKGEVYTRGEADGRFLPLGHSIRQMVAPANWVAASGGGVVSHSSEQATLSGDSAGIGFFNAALEIPQTIQGRSVQIDSFELCYSAADGAATLTAVFLFKVTGATAADIDGTDTTPIADPTPRDDTTCRTYAGAAPVTIGPNDYAQVVAAITYTGIGTGFVEITRLTLNMST